MQDQTLPEATVKRIVLTRYEGDPPFTRDRLLGCEIWEGDPPVLIDHWTREENRPPPLREGES